MSPMVLFGGPGDGAEVRVSGMPEYITWSQATPQDSPVVVQHGFRPHVELAALYRLNRSKLLYCYETPRTS